MYPRQERHLRTNPDAYLPTTLFCTGFTDYPLDILNEPPTSSGIAKCRYDFRQPDARNFFSTTMVQKGIVEDPYVDGLFIDNGQSVPCDEEEQYSSLTKPQRRILQRRTLDTYVDSFRRLIDGGKCPILSTTNRYSSVIHPLVPWENDCPDKEERTIKAFADAGLPFARNMEFWMWNLGDTCAAQLENAKKEVMTMGFRLLFILRIFGRGMGVWMGVLVG